MAGKLTASFILKLEDQLSGGLAKIEKAFERLGLLAKKLDMGGIEDGTKKLDAGTAAAKKLSDAVDKIGSSSDRARTGLGRMEGANRTLDAGAQAAKDMAHSIDGIGRSAGKSAGELSRMARVRQSMHQINEHVGVLGGVAAGYAVMEPIKAYSLQENALRHIAITEKKSGPAVEAEVSRLNTNLNREALLTGQNSAELAKAYNFLITTGMSSAQVDKLMPAHAQAATAYNISSDSMGQAVFALADTMKISGADMPAALASMAYAAKEGHFSVEDFSHFLPTVAASVAKLGMTGRGSADTTFAALETVRKSTGDAGTAATDLKDFLDYIVSPFGARSFAKGGIDLPGMLRNAEKQGVNPLDAVLGKLQQMTKGKTPIEMAQILGTVFHNQQARDAALALLRNHDVYTDLKTKFGKVDQKTIDTDFETAFRAPEVQVRIFSEEIEQLNRRLGQGFAPILRRVNQALDWLNHGLQWLDDKVPGLGDDVLVAVAAFALLVAGLAVLGVVLPALEAGFALLAVALDPVVLLIAAVAVAAYEIYENWDSVVPYFEALWEDVKKIFHGVVEFVTGVLTGDWRLARQGLEDAWDGIKDYYSDLWKGVEDLFAAFGKWVDTWTSGAWTTAINGILAPFKEAESYIVNSALGRLMGLSGANPANPNSPQNGGGHEDGDGILAPNITPAGNTTMTIELAPELRLRQAPTPVPGMNFNFKPLSPLGPTLGRP